MEKFFFLCIFLAGLQLNSYSQAKYLIEKHEAAALYAGTVFGDNIQLLSFSGVYNTPDAMFEIMGAFQYSKYIKGYGFELQLNLSPLDKILISPHAGFSIITFHSNYSYSDNIGSINGFFYGAEISDNLIKSDNIKFVPALSLDFSKYEGPKNNISTNKINLQASLSLGLVQYFNKKNALGLEPAITLSQGDSVFGFHIFYLFM